MFSKIIEGDYLYIDQAEIARSPIEQLSIRFSVVTPVIRGEPAPRHAEKYF